MASLILPVQPGPCGNVLWLHLEVLLKALSKATFPSLLLRTLQSPNATQAHATRRGPWGVFYLEKHKRSQNKFLSTRHQFMGIRSLEQQDQLVAG